MKSFIAVLLRLLVCLWFIGGGAFAHAENSGPTPEALEKARKINEQCFACHAPEALQHPPQAGLDLAKLRQVIVDPDVFKNADHGRLACTKCHNEGYDDFPHAPDAKDSTGTCEDCHSKKVAKIEPEFNRSVHAKHMADKFTCTTCHNPHVMRNAAKQTDAGKLVAQDNRICLGCHDSDQTFAKFAPEKKTRPPIDDIHSWLPNTRLHWQSVRCVECHTPLSSDMLSHEIVNKDKAERKCVTCHSVNTQLNLRLYRYLAKDEHQKYGFVNSVILGKSYVIGATRNPILDSILIGLAALTVLGVAIHGLLRIVAAALRRRK
ncbi:cytochrome c3 family protein [Uliginosibacterium gangwonense]|uniref:cytochrome c3 family protein n=1 Tax=Uliginosibacterium gangwonense TaxID=392736 RepID=UPI000369BF6A|nr:cytochrome c3 family protein [Uliginosibacterium gangwonense]